MTVEGSFCLLQVSGGDRDQPSSHSVPVVVDMKVGGEVIEPEPDLPVCVVELRERFES